MGFISDLTINITALRIKTGEKLNKLYADIGDKSQLTTSNKTNLVHAINELNTNSLGFVKKTGDTMSSNLNFSTDNTGIDHKNDKRFIMSSTSTIISAQATGNQSTGIFFRPTKSDNANGQIHINDVGVLSTRNEINTIGSSASLLSLYRNTSAINSSIKISVTDGDVYTGLGNKDAYVIGSTPDINSSSNRWVWFTRDGQIASKRDGDSSQWKQAYDRGDFRDYGLGTATTTSIAINSNRNRGFYEIPINDPNLPTNFGGTIGNMTVLKGNHLLLTNNVTTGTGTKLFYGVSTASNNAPTNWIELLHTGNTPNVVTDLGKSRNPNIGDRITKVVNGVATNIDYIGTQVIDIRSTTSGLGSNGSAVYMPSSLNIPNSTSFTLFHNLTTPSFNNWYSSIITKGWTSTYASWKITGYAGAETNNDLDFYLSHTKVDGVWGRDRKIWDDLNLPNPATRQWVESQGFSKQTLVAGTNIQINGSTISATNTTYATGTLALLNTGTNTNNHVYSPKVISDFVTAKITQGADSIWEHTAQGGLRIRNYDSLATRDGAIAIGRGGGATKTNAIQIGTGGNSDGNHGVQIGYLGVNLGKYGVSVGSYSSNNVMEGTTIGYSLLNNQRGCTVVGRFNDPTVINVSETITPNSPLFIIGSGESEMIRSNAYVMNNNGVGTFSNKQKYSSNVTSFTGKEIPTAEWVLANGGSSNGAEDYISSNGSQISQFSESTANNKLSTSPLKASGEILGEQDIIGYTAPTLVYLGNDGKWYKWNSNGNAEYANLTTTAGLGIAISNKEVLLRGYYYRTISTELTTLMNSANRFHSFNKGSLYASPSTSSTERVFGYKLKNNIGYFNPWMFK
ncbi:MULTISPECIES: hypothetical protein [unclassified Myroides]|uniref:hypothetical protein n=1 Tax=unclassified Myroides TaxID=2642485 RepID=UPI003D2F993E